MDCKTFETELMDLVLTPDSTPSPAAVAHMRVCPPCTEEFTSFQNTFSLLDTWQAPVVSPYFDQKLAVRLREEQAAPRMGWVEGLLTRLRFNTGRNFRPAMVGALSLALLVGGGSVLIVNPTQHATPTSAAVRDLQILDHNEQAFQQMDELQQDEDNAAPGTQVQTPIPTPTT
jgi:hypothetical protein